MTYDEYWNGDNEAPKFYRTAHKLRIEEYNTKAWLCGLYTYRAVGALVPVMNAFAKEGTKAESYIEEPIDIFGEKYNEKADYEKQKDEMLRYMTDFMTSNNRHFKNEGG